jgi:hypothetical protein
LVCDQQQGPCICGKSSLAQIHSLSLHAR